ncbi:peptidoglycan-binding protein [Dehalococcoidia bacterium]|nr:peptidoglycan-binding protein [Dehalococcoidia bacterium]
MNELMKKFTAGLVGLAMVLTLVPAVTMTARAEEAAEPTVEELLATIAELNATIAELNATIAELRAAQDPDPDPAVAIEGIPAGFTFDRNLRRGMSGDDVKYLQIILNTDVDTQLAETGVGSAGQETIFFGPLTHAAVVRFQEKHIDEILTPLGLTAGTGFVGPSTRAKLNAMLAVPVEEVPVEEVPVEEVPVEEVPVEEVVVLDPGLAVSLAVDTPAPTTIIAGQALAELARFSFANGDEAEVKVTRLVLRRIGVSADATLDAVYLYDGVKRLTEIGSVSLGNITFVDAAGIIRIPAGETKTISVKANIADGSAGQTIGVAIVAADNVVSDATAITGNFPINGNLMSIAGVDLAGLDVKDIGPGLREIGPGVMDYIVWESSLRVETRTVNLSSLRLTQRGNVDEDDVQNFRLILDGSQIATAVLIDNVLLFDMSADPVALRVGSRRLEVKADIIGGAGRNLRLSLRRDIDIVAADSELKVNIPVEVIGIRTSGPINIGTGTMTVARAVDSPTGDVVKGGTDVVLARYTLKAFGEDIRIEELRVGHNLPSPIGGTANSRILRNGRILVNGVQFGSTAHIPAAGHVYTGTLIVKPGSPVTVEVRADLYTVAAVVDGTSIPGADIPAGASLTITLMERTGNAETLTSLESVNVPAANVDGFPLTVKEGDLTVAKQAGFGDRNVVAGATEFTVARFVVKAGAVEAVNITGIEVDLAVGGGLDLANVSNLRVSESARVIARPVASDNSFPVNIVLEPNTTKVIDVLIDFAADAPTGGTLRADLRISAATGVETMKDVACIEPTLGPLVTVATGDLSHALDVATPRKAIVLGGTTVEVARYEFAAVHEGFTITDVEIQVVDLADHPAVVQMALEYTDKDGRAVTTPLVDMVGGKAIFGGLTMYVPADKEADLIVKARFNDVALGAASTGLDPVFRLAEYKSRSDTGDIATVTPTDNRDSKPMVLRKSVPTLASSAIPTLLMGGTRAIYGFTVSADSAGSIEWQQVKFDVIGSLAGNSIGSDDVTPITDRITTIVTGEVATDTAAITSLEVWDMAVNAKVAGTTTVSNTADGSVVTFVADSPQRISAGAAVTYELRGTIGVSVKVGDNISTRIKDEATAVVKGAANSAAVGAASFTWSDRSPGNDWTNDYLVPGIPTASITLSR